VPRLIILPQYPSLNAARRRFSRPPPDGRSVIRLTGSVFPDASFLANHVPCYSKLETLYP